MTITSEFTGTENYAERMAGLEAIHDWWFGTGSFAAAATLGQVRANLNTLLVGTTILNRETFATWLSKVNTLIEPTEYAAALTFGEGQSGALWRGTLPASLRAATDGTGEAAIGGTIARINDSSGNALHLTQASTSLRPIRGRRPKTGVRNLLVNTRLSGTPGSAPTGWVADINTGTVTYPEDGVMNIAAASQRTVIRKNVTLSTGASLTLAARVTVVSGTMQFKDILDFSQLAGPVYTYSLDGEPASGTTVVPVGDHVLSVTVENSGTAQTIGARLGVGIATTATGEVAIEHPQLEAGTEATAYQEVGASAFDVTEAGVDTITYVAFDLVDDSLSTGAIAGGLAGQAFVAGAGGCYVSDLAVAAGGAFSLGGTSHNWTGAAPGILRAVTGDTGRVLDVMIREDQSAANDYLANLVNGQMWGLKAEASGLGDSYPYLKPDEIEAVRPAFDALFRTIETRQTDSGVEMYSRATPGWGEVDADPEPSAEDMKAIARDVTAEMRQHGLDGKIKVEVVRDIHQRAFGVYMG